jgi:hypothetical protein
MKKLSAAVLALSVATLGVPVLMHGKSQDTTQDQKPLRAVARRAVGYNGGRKDLLGDKAGLASEIDFNDSFAGDVKPQ